MEIEAKFILPDPSTFRRLRTIKELGGFTLSSRRVEKARDTYLDTPERSILAAGYVCRRRKVSGKIIITLKQIERATQAVHHRAELEIELASEKPPAQWPASAARDLVISLVGDVRLIPLLHLQQRRTRQVLSRGRLAIAEMSLDNVRFSTTEKNLSLLELEIELMPQGKDEDLYAIAKHLQEEWKLEPDHRSKFERALEFVGASSALPSTELPSEPKPKPSPRLRKLKKPGIKIDDPMSEAVRKTLFFQFQRMMQHEAGTRAGRDIEELHDMRVATRRMRSALTVCDDYLDDNEYKRFAKALRRTGRTLGAVRDLDVFRAKTKIYLDQLPTERQNELALLLATWQTEYDRAREELLALFDNDGYESFKQEFVEFLQTPSAGAMHMNADIVPPPYRVRHVLPQILFECWERVRSFDEWVARPNTPLTHYHQLRIASKRLRYTLEFFQEVFGKDVVPMIEAIRRLQDHLGNLQDAVMACSLIQDFLIYGTWKKKKRRVSAVAPIVAPGVVEYLSARQKEIQELVEAFPPFWSEISNPEFNNRLIGLVAEL